MLCVLLSFHVQADISPLPDPAVESYLDHIGTDLVFRRDPSGWTFLYSTEWIS
jgi:hypothetical protein